MTFSLETPPEIVWAGVGLHGAHPVENFLIRDAWCLHLFRDEMELRVGPQIRQIRPHHATLIAPDTPIQFRFARPMTHLHFFAHFRAAPNVPDALSCDWKWQDLADDFEQHAEKLRGLIGFSHDFPARANCVLWGLLWDLQARHEASERPATPQTRAGQLCFQVRQTIELRLGQPLCVADLAREFGVSHNHLTRTFRAATGQTVVDFIRVRRVEKARYLLENTTLPIKVIAAQTGLGDFHSFNKAFGRAFGRSPRSFRR